MLLIAIVVGLLLNKVICLQKIITNNQINSTIYHIKLVIDEKAQPDSYIRRTTLEAALSIFEKIKRF